LFQCATAFSAAEAMAAKNPNEIRTARQRVFKGCSFWLELRACFANEPR
jgi:hypothetical protein